MNKFKNFLNIFTLILIIFNFKVFVQADDDNRIERIESQVQDALIKIKAIEKKNKNTTEMKVGPGLKIKSGKNEFKLGGRIHFDVGMYNNDKAAKCE